MSEDSWAAMRERMATLEAQFASEASRREAEHALLELRVIDLRALREERSWLLGALEQAEAWLADIARNPRGDARAMALCGLDAIKRQRTGASRESLGRAITVPFGVPAREDDDGK
jgi:hypothetical protein